MIDLTYAPTPNGHKITLFLRGGAGYRHSADDRKGNQFRPDFGYLSQYKIPAIVDHAPADGGQPLSLLNPAKFLPGGKSGKIRYGSRNAIPSLQWLPGRSAVRPIQPESSLNYLCAGVIPAQLNAIRLKRNAYNNVLNKRPKTSWLGGDHYSIADNASWPWLTHISVSESIPDIATRRCITV